nr:uncharacterized protein LOC123753807 [Procambarus clarkii]
MGQKGAENDENYLKRETVSPYSSAMYGGTVNSSLKPSANNNSQSTEDSHNNINEQLVAKRERTRKNSKTSDLKIDRSTLDQFLKIEREIAAEEANSPIQPLELKAEQLVPDSRSSYASTYVPGVTSHVKKK